MSLTRFLPSRITALLHTTRGRVGLVTLLALLAATFAYTRAQAASCGLSFPFVVAPSCFEAGDGDTAEGAGTDWKSSGLNVITFKDDTRDTQFSGGDKENDPGKWTIITPPEATPSPISPGKDEVLAGAVAGELVTHPVTNAEHVFVYGAFERLPQTGNTTIALELNKDAPKPATATQPKLPSRSEGDLLISYDGGVGSVAVRVCMWHGDDKGETSNKAYGWYSLPGFGKPGAVKLEGGDNCTLINDPAAGNKATGKVNDAPLAPGAPLTPTFSSNLGIGAFGEMSVDLTDVLDKVPTTGSADQCFGFGAMMIHTRTSDTGSASPKDFVEPQSIPKLTNCALELEKKVARDDGGTPAYENADSQAAAVVARTDDDLRYRFEVKNPSDFPFPQSSIALTELTSAGCDAAPAGPTNPDGSAVDGTLNKGETWVWECTRSGPLPSGSLENEAKVTGTVTGKEVASSTDKAYARIISPSLLVEKSGPAKAYSGSDVTFSITAENTGNDPITDVVITDADCDPALSNTPDSGDTDSDGVLDTDEAWSWDCVVKNATGSSVTNSAEVKGKDSLGSEVKDDDAATVALISPSLVVTKSGPAKAYAGSDVKFTIEADNTGNDPITDVVITDAKCDPALSNTPDSGDTDSDGVLDTNETWSWECTVKNATGSSLTNSAEVKGKDSLNGEVKDDDDATVALISPSLVVTKSGPAMAYAGSDVPFTVEAENTGDDPITDVVITDVTCDPALTSTPAGGDTDSDGVLDTNETWSWNCTAKNATGSSLTNSAEVKGKDSLGGEVKDDADATVALISPSLAVTKSGPAMAYAGDDVKFTIEAENTGDDPITDVVITDGKCDPALSNTPDGGDTDSDGVLDTDETWSWDCTVPNATGSSLTNSAEVKGKDSLNGEVKDDDDATVALISPSLVVTKSGPAKAYAGSNVPFTITAENTGNDPITDVVITDAKCDPALTNAPKSGDTDSDGVLDTDETWSWDCTVPNATGSSLTNSVEVKGKDSLGGEVKDDDDATVALISPSLVVTKSGPAKAYAGTDVTFTIDAENTGNDPITDVVITDAKCDPALTSTPKSGDTDSDGVLDTDETWSWDCVVKNATGSSLTNSAEVKGKDSLNGEVKDDDDATVALISPSMLVTKSGPAKAYSGSDVTFTITAENTGNDPITDVVITDAKCDPALSNTPKSGDTDSDGVLDTDETWSWDCTVKNATGSSLTNSAEVKGKDSLGSEVKDDDDATVALIAPALVVTKTGPAKQHAGDDVTFTITAENTGNDPITNVVITDAKCDPALSNTPKSGDTDSDGVLDTDETWTWECVVKNASGSSLSNTAEVEGKDSLGGPVKDDDTARVTLIDPELEVTKTGPASVVQGGAITWTITAKNTGNDPISNVVITDPQCNPPLSNTPDGGDAGSDGVLGVGETWTWTCRATAPTTGSSVTNVATVTGKDTLGSSVSDKGQATTALTVPPVTTAPQRQPGAVAGTAAFRQKARDCVSKKFRLDVTGGEIVKVTFTVDGKVKKVLTKPDASGRWSFHVNPSLTSTKRHRVRAIVEYSPRSSVRTKTLSYLYQRCTCVSRRNFTIRVRTRRADPVIRASVYVNGKRVQVIRGKRLKAPVKLIGLPKGRFTVKIVATTKSGRKITGERKYYTCRVKTKKKSVPKL